MAARYARPRLITSDDKRYRAYVEHFKLQRQNNRAMRPPRQRDIFGGQAEHALRGWLAEHVTLSDTRILGYEEIRSRRASQRYRELDAVAVLDRRTIHIFEIKASRTANAIRKAYAQLNETREILRLLYATVYTTILLVDTGIPTNTEIELLMASEEAPRFAPESLADVQAALPDLYLIEHLTDSPQDKNGVDLLRFTVDDIIALAGAETLALDWEADDAAAEEPFVAQQPSLAYTTDDPDAAANDDQPADTDDTTATDDSPLAAALRRAGLQRDQEQP